VEKYIRTGLESLLKQGMEPGEHEILLIDDGSTDDSGRICDEYAAKYPTIFRVFHKPNSGVSSTRNLGIREAKGEYIHFMDADDYMSIGSYRVLLNIVKRKDFDYISFGFNKVEPIDVKSIDEMDLCNNDDVKIDAEYDYNTKILCNEKVSLSSSCLCLVKRHVLLDNNLFFDERMIISEDILFIYQVAACDLRYVVTNAKIYHYNVRPSSATTAFSRIKFRKWVDCIVFLADGLKRIEDKNEELKDVLKKCNQGEMVWFLPKILNFKMSLSDSRYICDKVAQAGLLPFPNNNLVLKSANVVFRHPLILPAFAMTYRLGVFHFIFKVLCILNPKKYDCR